MSCDRDLLCGTDCMQALLARNYRGDIPMSAVEKFPILLSEAEEESSAVPPCFSHEGINVCVVISADSSPVQSS